MAAMINRQEIERLADLKSDSGIVSVYLRITPRLAYDRSFPATQFKGALKRATRRLKHEQWQQAADRESEKILSFLETGKTKGRSLVIFSCQPSGIWEVIESDVSLPTLVDVDATTKTGLLTRLLDEYPRLAVVVVQRDNAVIYLSEQRISGEVGRVTSNVPGQHDQGGWSQGRFERHIEFHVAEHLKKVVEELNTLSQSQSFEWLVVGGTEETVKDFLDRLPQPVAEKNIGTFPVDFKHDGEKEILERARRAREQHERETELQLVQQLFDAAKAGGQGTLGIRDTLQANAENRIRTLLVADTLAIDGWGCSDCDYVDQKEFKSCPYCGGQGLEMDIVDPIIEKAFTAGARIETLYGEARDRLMTAGGIGALLRY